MPPRRRLRRLNFGSEQAETDPLLDTAFYESEIYEAIASTSDRHRFLIGRTGSGKSAILQHLEETVPGHIIRIDPENLALNYILDLGIVKDLAARDVHLDPFFNALWKHVLLVEIIRHRYKLDSPESKRQLIATLRDLLRRSPGKRQALDYLDEFGEKFWCETDERVREITNQLETRLTAGAAAGTPPGQPIGAAAHLGAERIRTDTDHMVETDRLQRIINETQVARLNKMITVLDDDILNSPQLFTYVVIDDLDRNWADDQLANDLIRCLFAAVLGLVKVRNLKIVVALRTNIFDHLRFGSRAGGQEEKYRDLALYMRWTRAELIEFADERAAVVGRDERITRLKSLKDLLPVSVSGPRRVTALDYLLSRTLMRPRDVISFVNHALTLAAGKTRLSWSDLYNAERNYSKNRLLALRDEWKPTFPHIDRLFEKFRACSPQLTPDELADLLEHGTTALLADRTFAGESWLFDLASPMWDAHVCDWGEKHQRLLQLLYDIGFLGIGPDPHTEFSYDQPGLADSPATLTAATAFAVHPAFQTALDISAPPRSRRS